MGARVKGVGEGALVEHPERREEVGEAGELRIMRGTISSSLVDSPFVNRELL